MSSEPEDLALAFLSVRGIIERASVGFRKRVLSNRKMSHFALSQEGVDIRLDRERFTFQYAGEPRATPYDAECAPELIGDLFSESVDLPGGALPRRFLANIEPLVFATGQRFGPRWIWFSMEEDVFTMWIRPATDGEPPDGPEPLRTWESTPLAYADFETERVCPHCGAGSLSFRQLRDWFVCSHCGRSFSADAGDLATARVRLMPRCSDAPDAGMDGEDGRSDNRRHK